MEREPIWSVPGGQTGYFFTLFVILFLVGSGIVLWGVLARQFEEWPYLVAELVTGIASVGVASASISLVIIEMWGWVMLADIIRQRILERARREGREQGRGEGLESALDALTKAMEARPGHTFTQEELAQFVEKERENLRNDART